MIRLFNIKAPHSKARPWSRLAALKKLTVGPAMDRFPNTTRQPQCRTLKWAQLRSLG